MQLPANILFDFQYDGILSDALPINIHLLTLERWRDDSILLRLEHIFEANDHPQLSQPVSIALKVIIILYSASKH